MIISSLLFPHYRLFQFNAQSHYLHHYLSGILASLQAATLRQGGRQRNFGVSTTETSLNIKQINHLPYPENRRKQHEKQQRKKKQRE